MTTQVIQACSRQHLLGILALQQANLLETIGPEEAALQGFVTVKHTEDMLRRMNDREAHTILIYDGEVTGYALTMVKDFRFEIEILMTMFERIDQLKYHGCRLKEANYMVMGQVCIEKSFRGQGNFGHLYNGMRNFLSSKFDFCITEVATRNIRSMQAHLNAGLDVADLYNEPGKGEWAVFVWDWRNL